MRSATAFVSKVSVGAGTVASSCVPAGSFTFVGAGVNVISSTNPGAAAMGSVAAIGSSTGGSGSITLSLVAARGRRLASLASSFLALASAFSCSILLSGNSKTRCVQGNAFTSEFPPFVLGFRVSCSLISFGFRFKPFPLQLLLS